MNMKVAQSTLYKWARREELSHLFVKVGGILYIDLEALTAYVKEATL